ncbi:MAG TPA: tripartite tricarboxylate transporter substrate-binding protein [Xanthobacteraceae bacterium]|nr:tripartite tricarboxylate transporter substrate-binding protein [Xanthobacteraceae bacterium]
MKLHRRAALRLGADLGLGLGFGAAAVSIMPRRAAALDYPTRPVRVFVGYTPGSSPDVEGRLMAQWLSDRLGQQFVVENKPGAGTTLSTEAVARAAPDGYTLLVIATPNEMSGLLHSNLSFDIQRDIAPVAYFGATPFVMVVTPSFPAKTVAEFVAYAKANPGKVNMASNGTGNLTHVAGEYFKMMAGVDLFHVPYRGELEAQADLLSGRAHVMFDPIIASIGAIKAGKLRVLGVTTPQRVASLPDVPTVAETVPGYEVTGGLGLGATAGAPAEAIDKLNREINAGLADAALRARLLALGSIPTPLSPAGYRELIAAEIDKWRKVIKFANIKLS